MTNSAEQHDKEPDCSSFIDNHKEKIIDQENHDDDDDDNAMTMQDLLLESFDACPPN